MEKNLRQRQQILIRAKQSETLQAYLVEQCRRDIFYWFDSFCWTFDPRKSEPDQPFILYPYQKTFIEKLCRTLDKGQDIFIEKSRDMGVSWMILLVMQYYWLFKPGSHFLVGSRKNEYVDRKGDLSSLFEKLRYNLNLLPGWMYPKQFNSGIHDNLMRLVNPDNKNTITGESSNPNFARGGRYKGILLDEFPFWENDEAAYASAGQSSPCRIVVGTPYGKNNKFANLRFHSPIQRVSLHWKKHPLKNKAWYKHQIKRMSEDEIARELDINYNLSVKNRVFSNFTQDHKRKLSYIKGRKILRAWDFGYHCPACIFMQIDSFDRVLILKEVVGHQELLVKFTERVLHVGETLFPDTIFEDVCDPAGSQRSDKTDKTSIEILNSLGIYLFYERTRINDGIELIRMKLSEEIEGRPGLLVDESCTQLIAAFEGGYRYHSTMTEIPFQEHPYEDVMDCLRYGVVHKVGIVKKNIQPPKRFYPGNRYTGY